MYVLPSCVVFVCVCDILTHSLDGGLCVVYNKMTARQGKAV